MASPTVLAGISGGSTIVGGILGAIGAESSAASQTAMYNYKAGVALMNQRISKQNASWALASGDINSEEAGLRGGQAIGQTKVAQGASGLDVNSGTGVTVREAQQKAVGFDQDVIRFDAAKTAYGYEAKAAGDEAEANLDFAAGKYATTAGDISAATSILGAASSVSNKWLQGSTAGIKGIG